MGVRVATGRRYLGGFIGNQESQKGWLEEKMDGWKHLAEMLEGVALHHL